MLIVRQRTPLPASDSHPFRCRPPGAVSHAHGFSRLRPFALPHWILVFLLSGFLAAGSARAAYDWSDAFDISDYDGVNASVSGVYRDLRITVTDPWDKFPSASTSGGLLGFNGGGWSGTAAEHVMRIEKVDGSEFSMSGSMTLHYLTYSPTGNGPNYETRTATIKGYRGATVTGTITRTIQGPGSHVIDFSSVSGFTGITAIEFGDGRGQLWIGSAPITGSNAAPTDIALSASSLNQSAAVASATIGTLSSTDADSGETFTYALVSGAGSTHNASFAINGSSLRVGSAALGAGSYSVRIQTKDSANNTYQEAFAITIVDNVRPTVVSIVRQNPTQQALAATTAVFRVTFSEPVTGVGAGTFAFEKLTGDVAGSIASVSADSGATRDVTVNLTSGSGEFRIKVAN